MKRLLWSKCLPFPIAAIMGLCIFLTELFCLPANDEVMYAYGGMTQGCEWMKEESTWKEYSRVSSVADIVHQQYVDYTSGSNGRIWLHTVVATLSGFGFYWLFDLLSMAAWLLLAWLLLREGGIRGRTPWNYLCVLSLAWWFLWYAEPCLMNAAFAVNYLWMACMTIGMMALWRRFKASWWLLPIAFIFGWSQETFSAPMVAALLGGATVRSLTTKRVAITRIQGVALILMVVGLLFMLRGSTVRGTGTSPLGWIEGGIQGVWWVSVSSLFTIWPFIAMLLVAWIVWVSRKSLWTLISRSPEWWCYLCAAGAVACMTMGSLKATSMRFLYSAMVAAMVLILRERHCFKKPPRWMFGCGIAVTVAWMVVAMVIQIRIGLQDKEMLRLYRESMDGVTKESSIAVGPMVSSTYTICHSALGFWEFVYDKEHEPILLSPFLYDELYKGSWERFVASAQEIAPGSGLYAPPNTRQIVVARGNFVASDEQQHILEAYFKGNCYPTGIRGLFAAHINRAFPSDDACLSLPTPRLCLTIADGTTVTLLSIPTLWSFHSTPDWRTVSMGQDGTSLNP